MARSHAETRRDAKRAIKRNLKPAATAPSDEIDDEALIGARETRDLLNRCSEMHIWRLLNKKATPP
jgi:hypothetical protein